MNAHLVFEKLEIVGSSALLKRAPIAGIGWIVIVDDLAGGVVFVPDASAKWRAAPVVETVNDSTPTGAVIRVIHPNA